MDWNACWSPGFDSHHCMIPQQLWEQPSVTELEIAPKHSWVWH